MLSEMALKMEQAGRKNDIESATLLFNELKAETEKALHVLSQSDWIKKVDAAQDAS